MAGDYPRLVQACMEAPSPWYPLVRGTWISVYLVIAVLEWNPGYALRFQHWYQREYSSQGSNERSYLTRSYQTTNAVFLGTPPPVGYGFNEYAVAGAYGTPIVLSLLPSVRVA